MLWGPQSHLPEDIDDWACDLRCCSSAIDRTLASAHHHHALVLRKVQVLGCQLVCMYDLASELRPALHAARSPAS